MSTKIRILNEREMIDLILEKHSEWIESYNLDPYALASFVLAKELKIEREKAELHNYVEHAR